jgi:hypothetical protein
MSFQLPSVPSEAGRADYLVAGDKRGLLVLEHHKSTRIVSARIRRVGRMNSGKPARHT